MSTDASRDGPHPFSAGSVERLLDEFRATYPEVEALFRVHVGEESTSHLTVGELETVADVTNAQVCIACQRGDRHVEYLVCHFRDDHPAWFSLTETHCSTLGPIPVYRHNVADRLADYPIQAARTDSSPLADVEMPPHDLDPVADGVRLDSDELPRNTDGPGLDADEVRRRD